MTNKMPVPPRPGFEYRTRCGETVAPGQAEGDLWAALVHGETIPRWWYLSGRYARSEDPLDLVEELPPPINTPTAPKHTDEFTLDWPHGHMTRDGRPARILCTDARSAWPIVALVASSDGKTDQVETYTFGGHYTSDSREDEDDLVNRPPPPKKIEGFLNYYDNGSIVRLATREDADAHAASWPLNTRLACVPVTVKVGEGL